MSNWWQLALFLLWGLVVSGAELDALDQAVHGELAGDGEFPEPPEFDASPPPDVDPSSPWDLPPPDEAALEEAERPPPPPIAAQMEKILEDTQELGKQGSRARREWHEMSDMGNVEKFVAEASDEEINQPVVPVAIQDIVIFNNDDFDDSKSDESQDHSHQQL